MFKFQHRKIAQRESFKQRLIEQGFLEKDDFLNTIYYGNGNEQIINIWAKDIANSIDQRIIKDMINHATLIDQFKSILIEDMGIPKKYFEI